MAFKGSTKAGARLRNLLTDKFLEDLKKDYDENGMGAIRNMRMEHPDKYIVMVANLLPKEFEIHNDNALAELDDSKIDLLINAIRDRGATIDAFAIRARSAFAALGGGKEAETERVQARLLPPIS